jgi:hypothetical protein
MRSFTAMALLVVQTVEIARECLAANCTCMSGFCALESGSERVAEIAHFRMKSSGMVFEVFLVREAVATQTL